MKKITIMTPCKNGEKHLIPHIEGILNQTVDNLEYIFINDGSTDKTEELILSYKPKFEAKNWTLHYIKQDSKGQAAAMNLGLKILSGEYFSCIDSDDIILPDFCKELSDFLENNPQFSLAFPNTEYVREKTLEHVCFVSRDLPEGMIDNYFDEMIIPNNKKRPPFACFMIRTSDFDKIYPDRQIYEAKNGQNPQFIMPFAYSKTIGYVKKCLFQCVIRENSACRVDSVEKMIINYHNWEDIYCNVLKIIPNMPEYEKTYYLAKIKSLWEEVRFKINFKDDSKYNSLLKYLSKEKNKKIVLWGASLFLKEFVERYTFANNNILGIIDKNSDKINKSLGNLKIYSPEDIEKLNPDEIIITVVNYPIDCMNEINKILSEKDLCNIVVKTID